MNTWGWDYNLSSVFVNRNPLFAYNGTHRLAYALKHNPYQVVPIIVYRNGWKWSGENGLSYWQAKGMSLEDLDILKNRLELLLSNVDRSLYIVFIKKSFRQIIKDERLIVTEKFDAKIVKDIGPNFGINKGLHALFKKNKDTELVILKCLLNNQILVFKNTGICSIPIEEYIEKYENKALYYTSTITESNEFKILLDSLCVLNK